MKLLTVSISLILFSLRSFVFGNLDRELRRTIDIAMKCQYREPPMGPVMAATPSRFAQIVVVLHERFNTPSCVKTSKTQVSVTDEKTWPFCIFGKCNKGSCQCASHFAGPKCGTYTKKCWLMYCYLTSCHPVHQSLHCICDPSLYGTKITTGVYWYDEGRSSKYVPPPSGWEDEPSGMIKLKSDSAIKMGSEGTNRNTGGSSSKNAAARGSKTQNLSGGNRNKGSLPSGSRTAQKMASPNQRLGGKGAGLGSGASDSKNGNKGNAGGGADEVTKKTDVEEALEEIEEVSSMTKLKPYNNSLLLFVLNLHWMYRRYIT